MMRKIIQATLVIQIIMFFLIALYWANLFNQNKLLYSDAETVIVLSEQPDKQALSLEKKLTGLQAVASHTKVEITKVVWQDATTMTLYTNTPERFKLSTHKTSETKTGLSNQRGDFRWFDQRQTIELKSLAQLGESGVDGTYYLRGSTAELAKAKTQLATVLQANVAVDENFLGNLYFLIAFVTEPLLIAIVLLSFAMTTYALLFMLIQQSKKIALMQVMGYRKGQQLQKILQLFYRPLAIGFSSGSVLLCGLLLWRYQSGGNLIQTLVFAGGAILLLLCLIVSVTMSWLFIVNRVNHCHLYIKAKKPILPVLIVSKVTLIVFLIVLPLFVKQSVSHYAAIKQSQQADALWQQTKTVDQFSAQFMTQDYVALQPYEEKLKTFYLENTDNLMIIDAPHYQDDEKWQRRSRETQIDPDEGNTIMVNAAYLNRHPIYQADGKKINQVDIVVAPYTLNLLVPEKYKDEEKSIRERFAADFLFSAYELLPTYDETATPPTVTVNLIWVKDKQRYFSYVADVASATANQIPDPIVTVDTGNLAASVYYSIMTRNFFLIRQDENTDTEQWQAKLVDSGIRELIQTITPVYDQRAAQLRQHEQRVFFYTSLLGLTVMTIVFAFLSFNYALFERHKRKIILQTYYGSSLLSILCQHYVKWMGLDIVVLSLATLLFYRSAFVPVLLLMIGLQSVLLIMQLNKKRGEGND